MPVTDGKIAVSDPVDGTTYSVIVASDNYKDLQAEAVYETAAPEAEAVVLDKTSAEIVTSHKGAADSTLQLTALHTGSDMYTELQTRVSPRATTMFTLDRKRTASVSR